MSITTNIYTSVSNVPALTASQRLVTASFRNPSRTASIVIGSAAWDNVTANAPSQYRELLIALLDKTAKDILNRHLSAFSLWPSNIDVAFFCEAALLEDASSTNSTWMTKEEIDTAWRDSATRKAWVTRPEYAGNAAFRKAVAHYEQLISKLAGKTSSYTPEDLDLIMTKIKPEDLNSELGTFVARRVEALRNKPAPVVYATDLL